MTCNACIERKISETNKILETYYPITKRDYQLMKAIINRLTEIMNEKCPECPDE